MKDQKLIKHLLESALMLKAAAPTMDALTEYEVKDILGIMQLELLKPIPFNGTVPAMLNPGDNVIPRKTAEKFSENLKRINDQGFKVHPENYGKMINDPAYQAECRIHRPKVEPVIIDVTKDEEVLRNLRNKQKLLETTVTGPGWAELGIDPNNTPLQQLANPDDGWTIKDEPLVFDENMLAPPIMGYNEKAWELADPLEKARIIALANPIKGSIRSTPEEVEKARASMERVLLKHNVTVTKLTPEQIEKVKTEIRKLVDENLTKGIAYSGSRREEFNKRYGFCSEEVVIPVEMDKATRQAVERFVQGDVVINNHALTAREVAATFKRESRVLPKEEDCDDPIIIR